MKKYINKVFLLTMIVAFIIGIVPIIDTVTYLWTWFMYIKPGLPAGSVPPVELLNTTPIMAVALMVYFIGLAGFFTTNK